MKRIDVDAMLTEISPQQYLEWRAALDVVGIDDDWNQTAVLCQQIHNIGHAIGGVESEPLALSKYMPHLLTFKEVSEGSSHHGGKYQTADEMRLAAQARLGF